MARGFVYLVAVMDWFSRRVLAWRLSITLECRATINMRTGVNLDENPVWGEAGRA